MIGVIDTISWRLFGYQIIILGTTSRQLAAYISALTNISLRQPLQGKINSAHFVIF